MAIPAVGKDIDSFCGRCKLTLSHTILAMLGSKVARVQCNTCGAQHAYRTSTGQAWGGSSPVRESPKKVVISFEEQLAAKNLDTARRYSPKETYAAGDLLQHPNFGFGIVRTVRQDKVDVAFKAFEKTLVHARSGAPAARPVFVPPVAPRDGAADKPFHEETGGAGQGNGAE